MILNRQNPPSIQPIGKYSITEAKNHSLSNGIDLYAINAGNESVLKLDIVFNAGIIHQNKKCQANFTAQLISEGTTKYTAAEIAENLDFFGAYFQAKCNLDDSTITLYCLTKHLDNCLPYVIDVLNDAIFPEEDLSIHKKNSIQKLNVNEQRNSFLVRRAFNQHIFGSDNAYGSFATETDINTISREDLLSFYHNNYKNGIKYLLVSGLLASDTVAIVQKYFDTDSFKPAGIKTIKYTPHKPQNENIFIEKSNSVQCSIRVGRKLFNRNHSDFREMQLLNLILGGYFGSRLMKNIREEKGLTYGIYSALEAFQQDAVWYIDTEMNNELVELGVKEILKEIQTLREIPVDEQELQIAKNYLLGSFLRNTEGPFNLADRFRILKDYNLTYDYFYDFIEIIKNMKASQIKDLANKYLNEKDLSIVIVGTKQ
ncbi:MAG: pitrilysin family protein [Bacteroidota bacterium]